MNVLIVAGVDYTPRVVQEGYVAQRLARGEQTVVTMDGRKTTSCTAQTAVTLALESVPEDELTALSAAWTGRAISCTFTDWAGQEVTDTCALTGWSSTLAYYAGGVRHWDITLSFESGCD